MSLETVLDGHSILIFCPSKVAVEKTAERIAQAFRILGTPNNDVSPNPEIGAKLRQQLKTDSIRQLLSQLAVCPAGLDENLEKCVSFGVGFHHAG